MNKDAEEFIQSGKCSSDINELKDDFELDTQNLYARLVDLDHIINGKYASFSLEGY